MREARAQKPLEKPRRRRIDAARRAGPENHGAAGLGYSGIVRSPRSRMLRMLRPRPHQRCPRQAHRHRRPRQPWHRYCRQRRFPVRRRRRPRCHSRRPLAATWPPPSPSIGIALAATAYATLSLAVAVAAFAFAFAFAATAQPAQSASAALAALATVEGRGASLIRSRLIETGFDRCAERRGFLLDFA